MKNRKKAMLVYDFKNFEKDVVNLINIGDYTQTLAALNVVGEDWKKIKYLINREDFNSGDISDEKTKDNLKVIANGWYMHETKNFKIPENIKPLFISVHIKNENVLTSEVINEFKKHEPIGCRDLDTVKMFEKVGVKSFYSGCLTLSLPYKEIKRKGILFVLDTMSINDERIVSFEQFKKHKSFLPVFNELIKKYSKEEIENSEFISQNTDLNLSFEEQFIAAERMLEKISQAELVVTSRIHTLMPAIAQGSNALLVINNINDLRFKGLSDYWNYIDLTTYNKTLNIEDVKNNISYSENGEIKNKNNYLELISKTTSKVIEWWNEN